MIPGKTEKTEMMGSIGAVIKTPSGVESSCSSGNRLLDHALVDRVVTVEACWAVPWNSHVALGISILKATRTHTMKIARIPRDFQQGKTVAKVEWNEKRNEKWATQEAPQERAQKEAMSQSSKYLWIHEDAELGAASEKVGALYHRWSAAADSTVKTSVLGNTKSCIGRGTRLRTTTAPLLLHVAKHESHVGAGESRIWACLVIKNSHD